MKVRSTLLVGVAAGLLAPTGAVAQEPAPAEGAAAAAELAAGGGANGGNGGAGGGPQSPGPAPAKIKLELKGVNNGKVDVGDRVEAIGKVAPFVGGQRVEIKLANKGDTVIKKTPFVRQVKGKNFGRFKLRSKPLIEAGKYRVRVRKAPTGAQAGGSAKSNGFKLTYPDLDPGDSGPAVAAFNDLLRDRGYFNTDKSNYSSHTERAVMTFRKVNGMARNFQATPGIFQTLAAGNGGFQAQYPNAGKHAEVDISKQVMALVDDGEVKYTFHVSTGAPATPSDQGHFTFYRKDAGFNSLGMYYSVYYNRGEATHGYHSVPTYNASHGCIRNPIPDSVFIYNWIDLGDAMYVYG